MLAGATRAHAAEGQRAAFLTLAPPTPLWCVVCAPLHPSERGTPLSSKAARLYDTYLADQGNLTGSARAVMMSSMGATSGSCAGYTSQDYESCPAGKVCDHTYKPGDNVCRWGCVMVGRKLACCGYVPGACPSAHPLASNCRQRACRPAGWPACSCRHAPPTI